VKRRSFITLLGGAVAWPLGARAQSERMRRIGVLMPLPENDPEGQARARVIQQTLHELDWTQGRNIQIEYRWNGTPERAQTLAKELLALSPDALMATTTPILAALLNETRAVPIVFVNVTDPVGTGLVASLARPGGNATGFTNFEFAIGGKWVEALKEVSPSLGQILVISDPRNPVWQLFIQSIEAVAPSLGVKVKPVGVRDAAEIEHAIVDFAREPHGGLVVLPEPITTTHRALILALSTRHRLPAIYSVVSFAREGGLMSYGVDTIDLYRRAAGYLDRILHGVAPSQLPVQQPTKFELVINLKTARALGLTIPPTLLARADEVIE